MKNLIILCLISCFFCCKDSAQVATLKTAVDERPNFLFLLTDDQTFETINALNNNEIATPNLDKLVDQGVTFTHCFNQGSWGGAVCVASRVMLITGQTVFQAPKNIAYLDKWAQSRDVNDSITTEVPLWQEVFSKNGYETFFTGKWHNSSYALLKNFDKAEAIGMGMYETFDQKGSNKPGYGRGSSNSEWKPWDASFTGHWTPKVKDMLLNEQGEKMIGKPYVVEKHTSELFADKAINYLQTNVKNLKKPFFMYVAFNAPHDPRQAPKEFVDQYPPSSIKIPVNYMEEHPFDQGDNKIRDEQLAPFPRTEEAIQLHRSEYYAIISHLDRELGRILTALQTSGKADNTYVIFTSDHGLAMGQHGLMGKQNQYDHSVRMPLIIKGPGLKQGEKVKNQVYMQSIYATTCDLATIKIPESVEFKSFENLLRDNSEGGEKYIFGAYRDLQRMIRSDEYKLIVYPHNKMIQLFDMAKDPYETNNLAFSEAHQKIKTKMLNELILKQQELGDFLTLNTANY